MPNHLCLHDVVDALHEVLDDPVWPDLHLQPGGDSVRLDARDRLARDPLDLLLLLGRPLPSAESSQGTYHRGAEQNARWRLHTK